MRERMRPVEAARADTRSKQAQVRAAEAAYEAQKLRDAENLQRALRAQFYARRSG